MASCLYCSESMDSTDAPVRICSTCWRWASTVRMQRFEYQRILLAAYYSILNEQTDFLADLKELLYRPGFLGQSADDNHAATSVTNSARTAAGERWPCRPISHSRL